MATDKYEIYNQALTLLGNDDALSASADSVSLTHFDRIYPTALKAVLADADWVFAREYKALVASAEDPPAHWTYCFDLPSSPAWLQIRGIWDSSARRFVPIGTENEPAFEVLYINAAQRFCTAESSVILRYTRNETDTTTFPATFQLALAAFLGSMVAPIVKGTKSEKARELLALYGSLLPVASRQDDQLQQLNNPADWNDPAIADRLGY